MSERAWVLRAGQVASLEARREVLRCGAGVVWVTVEGDARDYVLSAGEALALPARGRVVIQALRDASLSAPPRAA